MKIFRRMARAVRQWLDRARMRREARRAFRYDERRFMRHAGVFAPGSASADREEVIMAYHVLEKGLTMPHRRMGFGREAALRLARLVSDFERRHGAGDAQVCHAAGVLRAYRELHRDWPEPFAELDEFLAAHQDVPAAVEPHVRRDDFYSRTSASFPEFAASRHVVRHFAGPVPRDRIEEAVRIATTAPSACNRQYARVHAIDDPSTRDWLFSRQRGTRGFGQDASVVLVVTADISCVRWGWERHDAFVNGGIFVMNLCYALHYLGIAHCILHWSVDPVFDAEAHRVLGIPECEEIVQVLACGMPPEEFDVAASPRRDVSEILSWKAAGA